MEHKALSMKMRHANHLLFKVSVRAFEAAGITRGMPMVLETLHERGSCIQRELAQRHHMNPASVTSVLGNMEAGGLIRRIPVKGDKRALSVSLTELGERKYGELLEIQNRYDSICFSGLSPGERAAFEAGLDRIILALREYEGKDA